jgi:broad specificity phosphatase PhoE
MRRALAGCLFLLVAASLADAQSLVFLVRHAERADSGTAASKMTGADPDLSPAGLARAESLAALLKDATITAIYITEYKRTRQTAAPLAKRLGIEAAPIASKDTAALAEKLKSASGNVLVVGHSNTIPEALKALGVNEPLTIEEQDFDNLLIVIRGEPPTLLRLHFR